MSRHIVTAPSWSYTDEELTHYHVPVLILSGDKLLELYVLSSFQTYSDDSREEITECYWVSVPEVYLSGPPLLPRWWTDDVVTRDVVKELWNNWSLTGCLEGVAEDLEPVLVVSGHGCVVEHMSSYVRNPNAHKSMGVGA